jgi:hypothetical protein
MTWPKAMGGAACAAACLLCRAAAAVGPESSRQRQRPLVIDPFCGQGTVLAVANEMGMDALGVELSRKRCRTALTMRLLRAKDAPGLQLPQQETQRG